MIAHAMTFDDNCNTFFCGVKNRQMLPSVYRGCKPSSQTSQGNNRRIYLQGFYQTSSVTKIGNSDQIYYYKSLHLQLIGGKIILLHSY